MNEAGSKSAAARKKRHRHARDRVGSSLITVFVILKHLVLYVQDANESDGGEHNAGGAQERNAEGAQERNAHRGVQSKRRRVAQVRLS